MYTKLSCIFFVLFVVIVSVAMVSFAYASQPQSEEVPYTIEQLPNGYLRVRVHVDLADRQVRGRYAELRRAEAVAYTRSNVENLSVQTTFGRPLSVEELGLLCRRA